MKINRISSKVTSKIIFQKKSQMFFQICVFLTKKFKERKRCYICETLSKWTDQEHQKF
jgi:hypothetical protein